MVDLEQVQAVTPAELAKWFLLKKQLSEVKTAEMLMRSRIFKFFFPTPEEGTNTHPLKDGTGAELKAVHSIDRKVDEGELEGFYRERSMLNLDGGWKYSRGDGQLVAVLDTGVRPGPRLPNVDPGGDFVESTDGLADCDGHGTLVAGLIAGQRYAFAVRAVLESGAVSTQYARTARLSFATLDRMASNSWVQPVAARSSRISLRSGRCMNVRTPSSSK